MSDINIGAENRIISFFNKVQTPEALQNRIWVFPEDEENSSKEEGIDIVTAKKIIEKRESLPLKQFTSFDQIQKIHGEDEKVSGLRKRTLANIVYSFSDIPLKTLADISLRIGNTAWLKMLPPGFADLTGFTLVDYTSTYDTAASTWSNVSFIIGLPLWSILEGAQSLSAITVNFDILLPKSTNSQINATLYAKMTVGTAGTTIPVQMELSPI